MSSKDLEYYRSRAEAERALAEEAAASHGIAAIHLELAAKYDALAAEAGQQHPTLGTGWDDLSPA